VATVTGTTLRRVVRARDYLHEVVSSGVTLDELARVAGLSRAHLARAFARTFGVPPHQYHVRLKMERAKLELARGASVTDACLASGFDSLGSFSACFHRRVGVSPSVWQRTARPLVQSLGLPTLYVPGCFLARFVEHV
jgi:AraC-like DNA-binding protein